MSKGSNKNTNDIVFSIIIPIYNCDKFLEKCIKSVLAQDYMNFELILINDGSTDNSGEICKKYSNTDKRIKYINKSNTGVSDSRNKGLSLSKGKYILFLDSDDYVESNYLSSIISIIEKYPNAELINFGFYSDVNDNENNIITSDIINCEFIYMKNNQEIKKKLIYLWDKHMLYNIWNKVYLSSIIKNKKIKFPNYNFGEDMTFNKQYIDNITTFLNSNKSFYHYIKEREGSITATYKEDLFDLRVKEFIEFNEYFEQQGFNKDEYLEFSSRRFIERVLGCVENICGSKLERKDKKKILKQIINNNYVVDSVRIAKPKSKKIKIMLLPIRIKSSTILLIMGNCISNIRKKYPGFFNKMKNRR